MSRETWSFGIFGWFGYQLPFEVKLDLIKGAGFQAICSWWGDSFVDLDGPKAAHARLARQRGLILENAHLPYEASDDLWQDSPAGQALVTTMEKAMAEAAGAGIPTLVIHPYRTRQVISQGNRSLFLQRAQRLGEEADRLGIRLAWENLYESRLVGEMMAALAHDPATGFCLDTGHANSSQDGRLSL